MENIKDLVRDIVASIELSFNRNGEMVIFYTDIDCYDVCRIVEKVVLRKYGKKNFKFICFQMRGDRWVFYAHSEEKTLFRIQSQKKVDRPSEVGILKSHEKNQLGKVGR